MKETVNFGFKKPENTDFVDVSVFGENFDKIDAELARKTIPIVLNQEIDLTQDINSIDVTEQVEALADRFAADLKRGIPVSVTFTFDKIPITVLLEDWFEIDPTAFHVSGFYPNQQDITLVSRFDLSVNFGHSSELQYTASVGGSGTGGGATAEQLAQIQANTEAIEALPISVNAENGYTQITGLPRATNIDSVQSGNTVTMAITMQDGSVINGVLTLNDDGEPVSYTEDGITCTFTHTVVTEEGS